MKTIILSLMILVGSAAHAETRATGKISLVHFNGDFSDRGVCIQMTPAMSGTWSCVFRSNALYKEITALIMTAYATGKTCQVLSHGSDLSTMFLFECW